MSGPLGISHIAVAVEDLDAATALWRDVLGLRAGAREVVAGEGVEVQMLHAGAARVELLRPLAPDSPVGRFLARHGPGLHHLALSVPDVAAAARAAEAAGLRAVGAPGRAGAGGNRIAFLHPSGTGGVLVELVERERHGA